MSLRLSNTPGRQPYHVLLIGEDSKQTELYSELVREVSDCQVDVVSRLERSFDWVGRSNYHLVVIDGGRADLLGLLERFKRISPVTSVILVSEEANVEEAVAAVRLGAEDYLKKPFNLDGFKLAVKRGLDRKAIFGGDSGASSYLNLLHSCQLVSATLEQGKIFGIIQSYISRELHSDHSAIYSVKDGKAEQMENGPDRAMEEIIGIALHASNPMPSMIESGEFYRFIERGHVTPGLFIFRFRCVAETDYFCVCLSPAKPTSIDTFEGRLRMLKIQIELTGKNIEQFMGVQTLAYLDDATGLYNTRYMNTILDKEIAQATATGKSFAILFIDADRFKAINDQHGHMVGTKLLNEMGAQLKKYVRDVDTVFRYGGDEFVAVLSPCDLATAQIVAERIRRSIEELKFLADEGLNIQFTVSIGVALFPDHASSKKEVIEAADHAMYAAKRKTRNSVFLADIAAMRNAPRGSGSPVPAGLATAPPIGTVPDSKKGAGRG